MVQIYHLNCVQIESDFGSAIGHCVLINIDDSLTLIDSGIGIAETKEPEKKLGKELIEVTGFKFDENLTAVKQIRHLGLNPMNVGNIICSHLDPDHIGGAADFPNATMHFSKEEYLSFKEGNKRYLTHQLSHNPKIHLYEKNDSECFGLPARRLDLDFEIYLIPLFGHTNGHCGVAYRINHQWTFYVGDAYYLRAELNHLNHPVNELAKIRAVDNQLRKQSLNKVRKVVQEYSSELEYFGYHDPSEFKP